MSVLKVVGRILIVLALASSAYFHLQTPSLSTAQFSLNYKLIDGIAQKYLDYDIPYDNLKWDMPVRIFGMFQALVVLFIVLGQGLGGFLYVLSVLGELFFLIWPKFAAGKLDECNFDDLSQISHYGTLLGAGLILICSGCCKIQK